MKNYYKTIRENLKHKYHTGHTENHMLRHFVELLGEERFNGLVGTYFRGNYPDSLDVKVCEEFNEDFHNFHKSMRQTDFFDLGLSDGRSGNLDMLWWNFIQTSRATEKFFRWMFEEDL